MEAPGGLAGPKNPGVFSPPQLPPELLSEDQDPFLRGLQRYEEASFRLRHLGYPYVAQDGRVVLAPWSWDWQTYGPCPFPINVSGRGLGVPVRARFGPYRWTARWTWRGASSLPLEVRVGSRVRRHMEGSLARLAIALGYLRVLGLQPSHLLTLTIPRDAWFALPEDLRPKAYRAARQAFLHRFRQFLERQGLPWSGLRWDEFQRSGVPHMHAYLALGGRLPSPIWERLARSWIPVAWSKALQEAGFPVANILPRTRLEHLRSSGTAYATGYAMAHSLRKAHQKKFPYEAEWGRTWDLFGGWREALRKARSSDRQAPTVSLDLLDLLVLFEALVEVGAPIGLLSRWLPLVQLVKGVLGDDLARDEVTRAWVGGFWMKGEREAFQRAWKLADLPPLSLPSPPPLVASSFSSSSGFTPPPRPRGRLPRKPGVFPPRLPLPGPRGPPQRPFDLCNENQRCLSQGL